ncbi:DMT family transporter [Embleya sp. NPDC056575]|uniref:DMT family transporter n=1 Tax=unclassified Embleya TaxID=2699296 RepID=UPI00368E7229
MSARPSSFLPASSSAAARNPRGGTGLLVLAGLLWGTGGLAGSLLASRAELSPPAVAAYRLLLGGILITAYAAVGGRLGVLPRGRAAWSRIATTGLLLAVFQAAYFGAVATTSVGLATLTTMVGVTVMVTVGSALLDRRRPSRRAVATLVAAASGLVLLLGSPTAGGHRVAGAALALLAAAGFAILSLDRREQPAGLDRIASTGLSFLAGAALLLPVGLVSGMTFQVRPDTLGTLLFLGLFPTAAAYTGYFAGLHRAGPGAGTIAVLLEPLTATVLAVPLHGEHLDGRRILGALLVLIAISIQQTASRDSS